jgi:threonine dehydratase
MARALRGDNRIIEPVATLADGVKVKIPGALTRRVLAELLDDVVIVREAELRETLVRLALEEHLIAEGAGALALAAGKRVAARRKCAVVSGGNLDASVLAGLLQDVRPRPPRKPRQRRQERLTPPAASTPARAAGPLPSVAIPVPRAARTTPAPETSYA